MLNLVYFYLNIYIKKYSYLRIFFYPLYIHLHVSRSNNQTEKLTSFVIRFWSLYFFSFISLYFFPYHVKFVDVMKRIVIKKKKTKSVIVTLIRFSSLSSCQFPFFSPPFSKFFVQTWHVKYDHFFFFFFIRCDVIEEISNVQNGNIPEMSALCLSRLLRKKVPPYLQLRFLQVSHWNRYLFRVEICIRSMRNFIDVRRSCIKSFQDWKDYRI